MFNENKIWHSVKERRAFNRKKQHLQTKKRRRLQLAAQRKRCFESRPFFKRAKFRAELHDKDRYRRLVNWFGEGDHAKALYHKEVHPTSNEFWWEAQFNHQKYITAKGRAVLEAKHIEEENKLRNNFKVFLEAVPRAQHARLKAWFDFCDKQGEYSGLFEDDDGIDENQFLEEGLAYRDVAWDQKLPLPILKSIVFLSKEWPINTIPAYGIRVTKNIEVTKDVAQASQEDVDTSDFESDGDAGF